MGRPFIGHAFMDWDDTLAENIRYFNLAEDTCAERVGQWVGRPAEVVRSRGQEVDLEVARRIGLGKDSLGIAWVQTYREFCALASRGPEPTEEAELVRICQGPYVVRQELYAGAAETLAWLHEAGFEVNIWTAGDHDVQERKIGDSGLLPWIHRLQIVPDKTPDRLRAALGDREPERSFVAGNSIHSDVKPSLALGLLTLHIPAETWAYDHGRVDLANPKYRVVERLTDLPRVLAGEFGLDHPFRGLESAG